MIENYILKRPVTKEEINNYYNFRWEQLRKPLDASKESALDEIEDNSYHIMVLNLNEEVIGVGRLHSRNNNISQIRFMAVDSMSQKKGVGSKILEHLEKVAINEGKNMIILESRESAIFFYKKNGYKVVKKTHKIKGGIQHYLMEKEIV